MKIEHLRHLISPLTGQPMKLASVQAEEHGEIREGTIVDASGTHTVRVVNFVPRFMEDDHYTDSFGAQWNRYRSVQIDSENKLGLTEQRFYRWTGWKKEELAGLRVLEAGCGAGRFTEVLLAAGCKVFSLDASSAVDACWRTNGPHENLCLVQADMNDIPYPKGFFDRVFCYGVLQHTPNPKQSFRSLVPFIRDGGKISIDSYIHSGTSRWTAKYLWRPLTTRISPKNLFKIVEWYVPKWLPVDTALSKIPKIGGYLVSIVPCWNYTGMLPLGHEEIVSWAILDTFDALSPKYDEPQTLEQIAKWFEEAKLSEVKIEEGSNGIVGNAIKP